LRPITEVNEEVTMLGEKKPQKSFFDMAAEQRGKGKGREGIRDPQEDL